jgi:Flp pilus assembly protein TadB
MRVKIPDNLVLPGIAAIIFGCLLTVSLLLFSPLFDWTRHRRRVAQVEQFSVATPGAVPPPAQVDNPVAQAALAVSAQLVRTGGAEGDIAERLDRAGIRLRPNEWVLWRIAICVVAAALLILPFGPFLGPVVGGLLGFGATAIYRRIRTGRRYDAFADQLPDSLRLVVGSLRAGFSLGQAIDTMIHEAPEPVATEFGRALAETRLGADLDDALGRLAIRMHSKDLEWVVVAVRIQREVGGNLAEVVNSNVETIREREELRRHVRALSAEGRLSAYFILPIPAVIALLMLIIRRDYIMPLFTTGVGLLLVALAGTLMTLGSLWMWRLIKVEV